MRADPEGLAQFLTGAIPREQMLYLDKATPVIAWLLSPLKRHEQAHFAAVCRAEDVATFEAPDLGPEPPADEILVPVEGRGATDEALDVGLGPACVIRPEEVKRFSRLLAAVDEPQLRSKLDFPSLDAAALPLDYWEEEGDDMFNEYVLPLFKQLQAFYEEAATLDQVVLVWYS